MRSPSEGEKTEGVPKVERAEGASELKLRTMTFGRKMMTRMPECHAYVYSRVRKHNYHLPQEYSGNVAVEG